LPERTQGKGPYARAARMVRGKLAAAG